MNATSQIVAGGGWKRTNNESIRGKAWTALFAAIGFAVVSGLSGDSNWFYACIPAAASLLAAVVLFVREKPRQVEFPRGRAGHDPRNLYAASDGASQQKRDGPRDEARSDHR